MMQKIAEETIILRREQACTSIHTIDDDEDDGKKKGRKELSLCQSILPFTHATNQMRRKPNFMSWIHSFSILEDDGDKKEEEEFNDAIIHSHALFQQFRANVSCRTADRRLPAKEE